MEDVHHLLPIACIWLIACHLIIYLVNNNCHYFWQLGPTEPGNKLAGLCLHISKKDMFCLHLHELELNKYLWQSPSLDKPFARETHSGVCHNKPKGWVFSNSDLRKAHRVGFLL